jgi:predicted nucleotidyltransferase
MTYGLSDKTRHEIISVLSRYPQIEKAILYGSRAMGRYREGSDIDLTLQGKNLTLQILHQIANAFDDTLLPYQFDLSVYHLIENKDIKDHIQRVGVIVYENTGEAQP